MADHDTHDHTGVPGVGTALTVKDEGTPLATAATSLDFVGAGVTASGTGVGKTITIPGGGGFGSDSATVATGESKSNAGYAALTTPGPAVTITVNTKCLVILSAQNYFSNNAGTYARMSFSASGANTIAAADTQCLEACSGNDATGAVEVTGSRSVFLSGLAPGSTTFTALYKSAGAAGTSYWGNRQLTVLLLD